MTSKPCARFSALTVVCILAVTAAVFTAGCSSNSGEDVSAPAFAPQPAPAPAPPPIEKPLLEHVVVKGDSLWKLAMDYDTTVAEIKQANKLENDVIVAGKKLLIPTLKSPPAVGAATAGVTGSVTPGQGTQPIEGAPASPPSTSPAPSPSVSIGDAPAPPPPRERSTIPSDVPFFRDGSRPQTPESGAPSSEINVPPVAPQ